MPRRAHRGKTKAPINGTGKLKCAICKGPLRDHTLGPCPEMKLQPGERLTVQRPHRARRRLNE